MSFEIPTLTTSDRVCAALEKVRKALPDAQKVSPSTINVKFAPAVSSACDRLFSNLVPTREGHDSLYTHLFRSVYATIASFWYCPPSVNETEFKAAIQGHYLILDEKNPEKRRSLAASRHYSDYEIADKEIAKYNGKRKGIKLGTMGIEPIEAFQKASTRAESPHEPQNLTKSSVRVYQADKADLEAIFNALELPETDSQLKKMRAFIAWAKHQIESLKEAPIKQPQEEEIQTIPEQQQGSAQTEVVETVQSNTDTDMHRQESPLEQKIDRLVTVMETFVMAQLNQTQSVSSDRKSSTTPKAERTSSEVSPTPRTRASSTDSTDKLNQAIDAIMAYNNAEGRLHDQKWAITINALKSWVKSQPKIMQALEARKEEISQHHLHHQIDPISHNYKHRGKRKIDEVIQIPSSKAE
jgi:soluble cytochrome b562